MLSRLKRFRVQVSPFLRSASMPKTFLFFGGGSFSFLARRSCQRCSWGHVLMLAFTVRGSACGLTSTLGRLSSIIAPIAVSSVIDQSTNTVLYLAGGGAFVAALALAGLPFETRGRSVFWNRQAWLVSSLLILSGSFHPCLCWPFSFVISLPTSNPNKPPRLSKLCHYVPLLYEIMERFLSSLWLIVASHLYIILFYLVL